MPEKYSPEINDMRREAYSEGSPLQEARKKRDEERKASTKISSRLFGRATSHLEAANRASEEAHRLHLEAKQRIDLAKARWKVDFESTGNAKTDQHLLQWYFERFRGRSEAYPVATDSFIGKSRSEYNAAWLSRELVQNFVDHNPDHPGTLDGVEATEEDLGNNTSRFTIHGNWSFEDPTGIISPHSDKPEGMNTAGGNGIGLKQTAIRLMRDFGAKKFEIQGDEWVANYQLVKKDQVNRELRQVFDLVEKPQNRQLQHDWLVAKLKGSKENNGNSYVIETDNEELIHALRKFNELGVSENNPYLKEPDFKNEEGSIKWILPKDITDKPEGRLFINGQVMNYDHKGDTSDSYWVGPKYMTLQLNNVDYKISVDRPPVNSFELQRYAEKLVNSMTTEQLVEQLKLSEPIWTTTEDEKTGSLGVILKMVSTLGYRSDYKAEDFGSVFGNKYLAAEYSITASQRKQLEERGFILCPSRFSSIGMPKASSELGDFEVATNQKPDAWRSKRTLEKEAEANGVPVAFEQVKAGSGAQLFGLIKERLGQFNPQLVSEPGSNKMRIRLEGSIPPKLLSSILANPTTEEQKALYFIRGVAMKGLTVRALQNMYMSQGEYVTTFALDHDIETKEDSLYVRNIKSASPEGWFIEFEVTDKDRESVLAAFQEAPEAKPATNPQIGIVPARGEVQPTEALAKQPATENENTALAKPRPKAYPTRIVDIELTPEAREIADKLEKEIPDLAETVGKLESIMPKEETRSGVNYRVAMYQELQQSGEIDRVALRNSNYLGSKTLLEILDDYNNVNISTVSVNREVSGAETKLTSLNRRIANVANRFRPSEEMVNNDFEIVMDPEERQLIQLGMLRAYVAFVTDAQFNNDFLLFRGSGTRAINIDKKAIGFHEELLKQEFGKTVMSALHEVAHNEVSNHGPQFISMLQALTARAQERLLSVIEKQSRGEQLDETEQIIQAIYQEWEKMR